MPQRKVLEGPPLMPPGGRRALEAEGGGSRFWGEGGLKGTRGSQQGRP